MLKRLVGAELAQVWFVRDYLQLIFEVTRRGRCSAGSGPESAAAPAWWRSASWPTATLCALIGEVVVAAEARHGL